MQKNQPYVKREGQGWRSVGGKLPGCPAAGGLYAEQSAVPSRIHSARPPWGSVPKHEAQSPTPRQGERSQCGQDAWGGDFWRPSFIACGHENRYLKQTIMRYHRWQHRKRWCSPTLHFTYNPFMEKAERWSAQDCDPKSFPGCRPTSVDQFTVSGQGLSPEVENHLFPEG